MSTNQITKAKALFGAVAFRNANCNGTLKGVDSGTVSINPASIAATSKAGTTFTLTGARAGDMIVMQPPAALEDDLLPAGAEVTADDTVTVYLYNPTGLAVDGAAATWRFVWLDLT